VQGLWLQDIESVEAMLQNADTRNLVLRIAHMSRSGQLTPFLRELADDADLDEETKLTVAELAADAMFLLAVEDYVRRTRALH
jgi:hypothetical protein